MVVFHQGKYSVDLKVVKLEGTLSVEDRQCAWELYTEIATRVAIVGKIGDEDCLNFSGEVFVESFDSMYRFFQEARLIMRKFPVGRIKGKNSNHLGVLINNLMVDVLRPFLEKWQGDYRHWWEYESNTALPPVERQASYPKFKELIEDWQSVRILMRRVEETLVRVYRLVDIRSA